MAWEERRKGFVCFQGARSSRKWPKMESMGIQGGRSGDGLLDDLTRRNWRNWRNWKTRKTRAKVRERMVLTRMMTTWTPMMPGCLETRLIMRKRRIWFLQKATATWASLDRTTTSQVHCGGKKIWPREPLHYTRDLGG